MVRAALRRAARFAVVWVALFLCLTDAQRSSAAQTLRVVCYNIEADIDGYTTPRPGLSTVLEAIGEVPVNGAAHPLDLLALEETTSNPLTVAPIVSALNDYYGAGTYAASPYQATESGNNPSTGNGPNAVVYNTRTLTLLASAGVGTPRGSSNGEYRQVARYEFIPVSGPPGTEFYVYVSHMKSSFSGASATNEAYRAQEATIIKNDIAALPANSTVLAVGDFNLNGSTEAAYQTLTATGTGQLLDPLNASNDYTQTWNTSAYLTLLSESATALRYRDDLQFMSAAVYNGTSAAGLHYVAGSCRAFGNNGTVALGKSVNQATNTALDGLVGAITPAAARAALATGSDHLPVVADYTVGTPYNAWQAQYFTGAELSNPAVSGDNADPDGDGLGNLLEYALGLDPRSAGTAGLPVVGVGRFGTGQNLTLTYTRLIAATDVTYLAQVSGDLSTWTTGADIVETLSTTNNADGRTQTVVVRDLTQMSAASSRFIRLLVTRP